MQRLQIRYAFSVPNDAALDVIASIPVRLWIEAGAGTGYWGALLQARCGVPAVAFDANNAYAPEQRFTAILTGGPELLSGVAENALGQQERHSLHQQHVVDQQAAEEEARRCGGHGSGNSMQENEHKRQSQTGAKGDEEAANSALTQSDSSTPEHSVQKLDASNAEGSQERNTEDSHANLAAPDTGLLLGWPDVDSASTFGRDCLQHFGGQWVAHVGELLGETQAVDPWGQSTASSCQLALARDFRLVRRVSLPRWPGQRDSLTLWKRVPTVLVECDGAEFVPLPPEADGTLRLDEQTGKECSLCRACMFCFTQQPEILLEALVTKECYSLKEHDSFFLMFLAIYLYPWLTMLKRGWTCTFLTRFTAPCQFHSRLVTASAMLGASAANHGATCSQNKYTVFTCCAAYGPQAGKGGCYVHVRMCGGGCA